VVERATGTENHYKATWKTRATFPTDAKQVIEVIPKGAAQSAQLENRGPTMIEDKYNFGFAVDWMRKDLQICLDEARRNGALLPITAIIEQYYGKLQEKGYGRLDSSSLMKLLTEK